MYPDTLVSIFIIIVLLCGLAGIAYFLEKRSKQKGPIGGAVIQAELPPPGPLYKISVYSIRILTALMVLSIIVFVITNSKTSLWIGLAFLGLYFIAVWTRRIARLSGK
jgi:hypothetical protein